MEQHPVPQNVTTFQFRLIGDMTIKQFGYLAGGAILAYISYKLPLPFFFTWPLAITFAMGGFGFAFVPIEERPMDIWVMSFIKSVYSPTQFVWHKAPPAPPQPAQPARAATQPGLTKPTPAPAFPTSPTPIPHPVNPQTTTGKPKTDILQSLFGVKPSTQITPTLPTLPQQKPTGGSVLSSQPRQNPFDWLIGMFMGKPKPPTGNASFFPQNTPSVPMPSVTGKHFDLSPPPIVSRPSPKIIAETQEKEHALEHKVQELKSELETKTMTESRILELQKQLTEVLGERERMEKELAALRKQVVPPSAPAAAPQKPPQTQTHGAAPPSAASVASPKQPTVKIITPEGAVRAGLPKLTTFPNVVTGIVKDSEHNLLPGVLVTVKDREGLPLRALKTNRIGQFAASTPLSNGVYFIEIEDPRSRYSFDRVQITFNGTVVPALEIIAKSQKEISRAKLEKELFGNQKS